MVLLSVKPDLNPAYDLFRMERLEHEFAGIAAGRSAISGTRQQLSIVLIGDSE
jgi:hypothetical protein